MNTQKDLSARQFINFSRWSFSLVFLRLFNIWSDDTAVFSMRQAVLVISLSHKSRIFHSSFTHHSRIFTGVLMLYFRWLKGSAVHVSKALEKNSASRSAGKGETYNASFSFDHTYKEINSAAKREPARSRFFVFTFLNSDIIINGAHIYAF